LGLAASPRKDVLMPTRAVSGGHRYGKKGKLYRGKGSRAKANRQGRAIKASQARRRGR
jgi:hypothetical protein